MKITKNNLITVLLEMFYVSEVSLFTIVYVLSLPQRLLVNSNPTYNRKIVDTNEKLLPEIHLHARSLP